jgi:hypothetical protein
VAVHNNDDSVASNFLGTILQEERTEEGGIKMKACEVRAGITREAGERGGGGGGQTKSPTMYSFGDERELRLRTYNTIYAKLRSNLHACF